MRRRRDLSVRQTRLLQTAAAGATALLAFMAAGQALTAPPAAPPPIRDTTLFESSVRPLLFASCVSCHGKAQQAGDLRVDSRAALLKGGASGAVVVPGKGKDSLLLKRVLGHGGMPRMPLGFAPLTAEQTNALTRWIDAGAPWPEGKAAAKHWAYVAPKRAAVPKVKNAAWVRNPIDAFVLARLEKEGLKPSPPADRATLLRRVSLDLIGLPPTPEEVDAFVTDARPDAYERQVDRLLASPHYGERWARIWLDLARYADTNGYVKDGPRVLWPWRDWVIDALNRDMPFDRFTIEQLAGDLLPNATVSQRVATGFHRNTMRNEEGGVDQGEQRWLTQVDRVGTTGAVWLGSTVACSQCHDHKYDPFPQRDFYKLLAFFDSTEEPSLPLPTPEQTARKAQLDAQIAAETDKAKQEALKKEAAALRIPTTLVLAEKKGAAAGVPTTPLRIKGAYLSPGEAVACGTPEALGVMPAALPKNRLGLARWLVSPTNPLTGRVQVNRAWEALFGRGLVETSDDFGTQGQLPSHPELLDWLATGFARPASAPSGGLGWSQKKLHRLIVTSATYRQSSRVTPALLAKDPENRLLARGARFRLEAEAIRDNALAAGGLLSRKVGGPSVFPDQPDGIWNVPYSGERWTLSEGADRWRRGLYTYWRRTAPYPAFLNFDATSREFCTLRRTRTNTPLQALTTLNDTAFVAASRALAKRMLSEAGPDPRARVVRGFRLCVARRPKDAEAARLVALYGRMRARYAADPEAAKALAGDGESDAAERAAWTMVANVLLNLDETLTKE